MLASGILSRREEDAPAPLVDRRRALWVLGGAALAAVAAACGKKSGTSPGAGASPTRAATGGGGQNPDCVLARKLTEGPYYIDLDNIRSDIMQDRPGAPMKLDITVVDAASCKPVKDAAVDVWHCDARGEYSGFGGQSGEGLGGGRGPTNDKRFLRGTQITDAKGLCTFQTIYPGWYPGRTVHIHLKVHAGGKDVHTGQLFFNDEFTDGVYEKSPYSDRPNRDVRNNQDGIYAEAAGTGTVDIRTVGEAYDAAITVGVQTT